MMATTKTLGQIAYEEDVRRAPTYPGTNSPRAAWCELEEWAQQSWERDPTAREYKTQRGRL